MRLRLWYYRQLSELAHAITYCALLSNMHMAGSTIMAHIARCNKTYHTLRGGLRHAGFTRMPACGQKPTGTLQRPAWQTWAPGSPA